MGSISSRNRLRLFSRRRNDKRQTGARGVQVAPVPAGKSASDVPAYAPVTEVAGPGPGC